VLKQWLARALSLAIVGPLCARLAHSIVSSDGSHQTTLLTGNSLSQGILMLIAIMLITLVMGVGIARLVDRREGLLNVAFVLGWVAWTSGRLGEVYRGDPGSTTLIRLSLESVLISGAMLVILMLMTNPSKGMGDGQPDEVSRFDPAAIKNTLSTSAGIGSMLGAIVGAFVIAILFGQNDLPGQSVGVGFIAGIASGVLGTLAAGALAAEDDRENPTPYAPIVIGGMLAGIIAPLVGLLVPGGPKLLGATLIADLPGYLVLSPMAWIMGALLGVPIGHSWVEHSTAQTQTKAPSASA